MGLIGRLQKILEALDDYYSTFNQITDQKTPFLKGVRLEVLRKCNI